VARAPDEVVERIKREISVERLVEARGIKLKRVGKNLMGLCPFHKEKNPSLAVTPGANKWRCFGCGRGGTVFDWVMRTEGISFNHALQLLRRDLVPLTPGAGPPVKISTVPKLPPLIESTADDKKLLEIVVAHYHEALKQSPEAQQYLLKRGLKSAEMVEQFRLGFANRTLGYHMPASNRVAGADQRGRLKELGVLRENGREHLRGSVVIPILNLDGDVMQMYGRKITPRNKLREETSEHLYLPGPLHGVWNEQALIASKEIILCEALIDALTFWCAGYRNVTTIYGVNNFTGEIKAAFRKHGTKRIYLAYDRDEPGERAAQAHSEEIMTMGIECLRVQFPRGQDANEFAQKNQPAAKFLGMYLTSAAWLGNGKRPTVKVAKPAVIEAPPQIEKEKPAAKEKIAIEEEPRADVKPDMPSPASENRAAKEKISEPSQPKVFPLAADPEPAPQEESEPRPMPLTAPAAPEIKVEHGEAVMSFGPRTYRVLNLGKCTTAGKMHVNVKVSGANVRGEWCYHGDTFDMESFPRRAAFIKQAAHELAAKEETIHREVGQLWGALGDLQRQWLRKTLTPETEETIMTAEEQAAAMELLRDPRLLDRVLADFEKCGVVGEETNKRVSYLAAVSRLLGKPLAIVVQSASSAGKTLLMDAVLDFIPEEQRESYTAMTGQALFYMGQKNLKHKILAVSEEEGAQRAAYALKLLQSEGKLKIASTGKDPVSGKHVTHEYVVEGPVMIFLTTTAHDVDEELLNRCVVLTVNEDREQTRAIHQKQRESQTLEGLKARMRQNKIIRLHRNAQRLLRPVPVVIEHLKDHSFPDAMTRTRRDHMKFLTLIQAVTLLHQHQREIKTSAEDGATLEYIEATETDVKLAWELTNQVLVRSLDDVQPQTRRLLLLLDKMVSGECARLEIERMDYRFTRATVRRFTGWSDSQLKTHLCRLEDLEYLALHRGAPGQSFVYALNFEMDEQGRPVLPGLSYGAKRSGFQEGVSGPEGRWSGSSLGQVWGVSGGGASQESPAMMRAGNVFSEKSGKNISRGAEAHESLPDAIIVAGKSNGANGHRHAAVK
jgi:DNA primase catalytic core